MPEALTLAEIQKAGARVTPLIRRTPLRPSRALSKWLKSNVYVKQEMFQRTGSFKVRGVLNKLLSLKPSQRQAGVVTISGGNHAQAVAWAARALEGKAVILMPEGAPSHHQNAAKDYGADIRFAATAAAAFSAMAELEREGLTYIHPFDDLQVMAGQGTLGLEILEDAPQVTDIILPIGGGGLMTGVATAVKSLKPAVRIWGVETEGADCMAQSLAAGKIVTLEGITSVARSLGATAPSETTFQAAQELLESVTLVPDSEAIDGIYLLLERLKVLAEPAAACTIAAADRLRAEFLPNKHGDKHVVLLLSGGNVSASFFGAGS